MDISTIHTVDVLERRAQQVSFTGLCLNIILALTKIVAGLIGQSYALVADGIESTLDVFSSLVTLLGLRIAAKPPDDNHPYGHGKAESLAGLVAASALLVAALGISIQSIRKLIAGITEAPAVFTLLVLVGVIAIKLVLAFKAHRIALSLGSKALKAEAVHHGSDALTSFIALLGIAAAVLLGPGYEAADVVAALLACVIIFYNGGRLFRESLTDIMDTIHVGSEQTEFVRSAALEHREVHSIDKCRLRMSGYHMVGELHLRIDGQLSVTRGHEIAHEVKESLQERFPNMIELIVHIEPQKT
jgi:cation diffusion facilitator family transporter